MTEAKKEQTFDSWVLFRDAQGAETRAAVQRLNRHQVVFEHCTLDSVLRVSEALDNFQMFYNGAPIYGGRAVVRTLINSGPTTLCEAKLEDGWSDLQALAGTNSAGLLQRYKDFFAGHKKLHHLSPEYTAAVAGLQNYLTDVRLWLDHLALGLTSNNGRTRGDLELETARQIQEPIARTIFELFDRFEEVGRNVPEELVPAYYAYAQRQVRPLLMDAPFVFRTFRKPLGYAGDYKMVAMMFGEPCEGPSIFARVLNSYSLSLPPIVAHRNRIDYLADNLEREVLRVARARRRPRIYNLGCGPAREVQKLAAASSAMNEADFTLVDFNEETLTHARQDLERVRTSHVPRMDLRFVRKSVQQVLKESTRIETSGDLAYYDAVYCAGLFDYLSTNVCKHLVEVFWRMVAPGGLLMVTNVDHHPSKAQMECFLDWNLIYRDSSLMRSLVPAQVAPEDVVLKRDPTGVNIFLELRKPAHGE